jgi:hypothetical protein
LARKGIFLFRASILAETLSLYSVSSCKSKVERRRQADIQISVRARNVNSLAPLKSSHFSHPKDINTLFLAYCNYSTIHLCSRTLFPLQHLNDFVMFVYINGTFLVGVRFWQVWRHLCLRIFI